MVMILVPIILVYSVITFVHLHEFTDPISFFTSAIKANPKNVLAYGERGTGYNNIGNNEKAMSDFDKAIKINPGYSTPYFNKGVLYAASGDHLNAEYYFSLALNADTLNHEIRLLKGNAYLNLSNEKLNLYKFNEDIVLIKKGIREYPEYAGLHNNLGLAYYYTLKFDSALFEYTLAIDLDKNSAKFYNSRGMARYHLNDFIGALSDFDMTLELKPDFLDALGNRGMVKIKTNDFEGAVSDLTKAVNLNPSAAAAYYFRGIAFMSLKKTNEAKNDWQQALNLGYKKAEEKLNSAGEK